MSARRRITFAAAAVLLAAGQQVLAGVGQGAQPVTIPAPSASASSVPALPAKAPTGWIEFDDATYTPVVDDVSRSLAEARAALDRKDNAKASEAMRTAARDLEAQADAARRIDRQRAAADMKLAWETHTRMMALTRQLDAAAAGLESGKLASTAALDRTLDKAARADLERRWLFTDVTGWYPVAEEPQRHFGAAVRAFAQNDYTAAATEVRKAAAFVRLESTRAVGAVKSDLEASGVALEKTAQALERGAVRTEKDLDGVFANAEHALALSHRAKAAESWAHKAYNDAGYELKAAAQGLEGAAGWTGAEARSAAAAGSADARAVGDKLVHGGNWARDEVAKGFESLGGALDRLGEEIGAKTRASHFVANG